MRKSLVK